MKLAAELFAQKGYQATTVRNIADKAGILSGSLYHHFDSKESIVDEILTSFFDELAAANQAALDKGGDPRDILVRSGADLVRQAGPAPRSDHGAAERLELPQEIERFDYLAKAEAEAERLWVDQIKRDRRPGCSARTSTRSSPTG